METIPGGRVFLVDPQTDVGRPLSAAQPIPGHDIIREAMHIQQQKARMLNARPVQLLMMPMIPDQRFPAQFGRNRLDPCPVHRPARSRTPSRAAPSAPPGQENAPHRRAGG